MRTVRLAHDLHDLFPGETTAVCARHLEGWLIRAARLRARHGEAGREDSGARESRPFAAAAGGMESELGAWV
jgi:hypothetical protein